MAGSPMVANATVRAPAANAPATAAAAASQAAARPAVTPPGSFSAKATRRIRAASACARTVASARPCSALSSSPGLASTGTNTWSAARSTRIALTVISSGSPGPTPTPISGRSGEPGRERRLASPVQVQVGRHHAAADKSLAGPGGKLPRRAISAFIGYDGPVELVPAYLLARPRDDGVGGGDRRAVAERQLRRHRGVGAQHAAHRKAIQRPGQVQQPGALGGYRRSRRGERCDLAAHRPVGGQLASVYLRKPAADQQPRRAFRQ